MWDSMAKLRRMLSNRIENSGVSNYYAGTLQSSSTMVCSGPKVYRVGLLVFFGELTACTMGRVPAKIPLMT